MKNFLLLIVFSFPMFLIGQHCEISTNELGLFEISEIADAQNFSKSDIYKTTLVSASVFNLGFTGNRSYEDKDLGIFITEMEVALKNKLTGPIIYVFDLKVEVKEGKYRITVNYKENIYFLNDGLTCGCTNDFAHDKCEPIGCGIFNTAWNKNKCKVLLQLENNLTSFHELVSHNLSKLDW